MNSRQQLKTGSDPRALADYHALREEMIKLSHPARPDVDWRRAETLCLRLFEHNGVELQTAAWYTLARMHIAGLAGLQEGLALIAALTSHQWSILWPLNIPARMEIITGLSQRLQSLFRSLALDHPDDLPLLLQNQQHLAELCATLARHQLKQASRLASLQQQLLQAITRLENQPPNERPSAAVLLPPQAVINNDSAEIRALPWVYVVQPEAPPEAPPMAEQAEKPVAATTGETPVRRRFLPTFLAGAACALLVGGAMRWGWQYGHPLPVAEPQADISPLPPEALNGWHDGMRQLAQLAERLNALDQKRGKYITVSELKSVVFASQQAFNRTIPLEERLRLAAQTPPGEPLDAAAKLQMEMQLKQLTAGYAQVTEDRGAEPSR